MTDKQLEQRLRAWYSGEVDADIIAPGDLRTSILSIPAAEQARGRSGARPWTLLAAAALIAVVSIVGALVGGSLINNVRPIPTAPPTAIAPAVVPPTPSPSPTPSPAPTPSALVLPQTLIAAYHALGDTAEVLTIDPQTGEQVPVGTLPIGFQPLGTNVFADTLGPGFIGVKWSTDRRLITVANVGDGTFPRTQFDLVTDEMAAIDLRDEAYVSPDGRFFAILGFDPSAVLVVDVAGNVVHRLDLPVGTYFSELGWAPDGSAVIAAGAIPGPGARLDDGSGHGQVFAATALGPVSELVVPINGDPARQYGGSAPVQIGVGSMSPDMSRLIASSSCETGAPPSCTNGLVTIDVASTEITQLTTDVDDTDPQWSPDGSHIAFVRWSGPDRGVWVMNADGSDPTRLTAPARPNRDHDIAWAPDGSAILFTRGDITQTRLGDLSTVPSTGGDPRLLLSDATGDW